MAHVAPFEGQIAGDANMPAYAGGQVRDFSIEGGSRREENSVRLGERERSTLGRYGIELGHGELRKLKILIPVLIAQRVDAAVDAQGIERVALQFALLNDLGICPPIETADSIAFSFGRAVENFRGIRREDRVDDFELAHVGKKRGEIFADRIGGKGSSPVYAKLMDPPPETKRLDEKIQQQTGGDETDRYRRFSIRLDQGTLTFQALD